MTARTITQGVLGERLRPNWSFSARSPSLLMQAAPTAIRRGHPPRHPTHHIGWYHPRQFQLPDLRPAPLPPPPRAVRAILILLPPLVLTQQTSATITSIRPLLPIGPPQGAATLVTARRRMRRCHRGIHRLQPPASPRPLLRHRLRRRVAVGASGRRVGHPMSLLQPRTRRRRRRGRGPPRRPPRPAVTTAAAAAAAALAIAVAPAAPSAAGVAAVAPAVAEARTAAVAAAASRA